MNNCKACQLILAYGSERCSFCGTCQLPQKWVKVTPGVHKLVDGDDPRPAIPIPEKTREDYKTISIKETPSWVGISNELMPDPMKNDSQGEIKATDAMLEDRKKTTSMSAKARSWEEGRKKEWAKNKPYYRKEVAYKEQKDREKAASEAVKSLGI